MVLYQTVAVATVASTSGSEVIKEDLEVPNQQHKRVHTSHTAVYGFVAVASLYRAALSARCSALLHTL